MLKKSPAEEDCYLVCLIYLVEPDKPNRPNKPDEPAVSYWLELSNELTKDLR